MKLARRWTLALCLGVAASLDLGARAALAGPGPESPPAQVGVTELIALADALESRGDPMRAIATMDKYRFNFASRAEFWARLARLYENNYDFEKALLCLEAYSRLAGLTVADALRQATLLCNLLRPAGALTRLLEVRAKATETDLDYWNLLGALSCRMENYPQAVVAYEFVWKHYESQESAERLVQAYELVGRSGEAVALAIHGYRRFGVSSFFETALDLALSAGLMKEAKALFVETRGHEVALDLRPQFLVQRGQFASAADEPATAEQDFRRALQRDPGFTPAHLEWLRLAVQTQDRAMASRALQAWAGRESSPEHAELLAETHALLGDRAESRRYRARARALRVSQAGSARADSTANERLERALDLDDRRLVRTSLTEGGTALSLPLRVAALRELGEDHVAWNLIDDAGLADDRLSTPDALTLSADVRALREGHLDGAWALGGIDVLGQLVERSLLARTELRWRRWFLGIEGGWNRLTEPADRTRAPGGREDEQSLLATARLPLAFGESGLKAGVLFLREGTLTHIEARQHLKLWNERLDVHIGGVYGEVPRHSVLLRMAGLRAGVDADVTATLARAVELGASIGYGRFSTRAGEFMTSEKAARIEVAFHLPFQGMFVRPRLDAFANRVPVMTDIIPDGLAPFLTATDNTDDLLGLQYRTVGLGTTFGSNHGELGDGIGPSLVWRYRADVWGGYVWPNSHPSYAFDLGLGLVIAHHQEISMRGYYAADFRNATGQGFWNGSLNYTVRWFR
jgi:tetratricopeptide (TPR) repeat protein